MTVIERELTLNVDRLTRTRQMIRFTGKVGDHQSRRIVAHILNGAAPFAFEAGDEAFLNARRENPQTGESEEESFEAAISEGAVRVTVPVWVFTYPGNVKCEIVIASASATIRTEDFYIQCIEAVKDSVGEPPEDGEVQTLTELIAEAQAVLAEMESAAALPEVTAEDEGKIVQVKNSAWNVQYPELGEESIHILTNSEIETLLANSF